MIPSQPKVLVVDDDKNILSAFEDFLRREHCAATLLSSVDEALKRIESERFHLLISDIRLEKDSGIMLVMEAKRKYPELRVIVITGFPDVITEQDARRYGADYFLLKPLELDKLQRAVRSSLLLREK